MERFYFSFLFIVVFFSVGLEALAKSDNGKRTLARSSRHQFMDLSMEDNKDLSKVNKRSASKVARQRLSSLKTKGLSKLDTKSMSKLNTKDLSKLDTKGVSKLSKRQANFDTKDLVRSIDNKTLAKFQTRGISKLNRKDISKLDIKGMAKEKSKDIAKLDAIIRSKLTNKDMTKLDTKGMSSRRLRRNERPSDVNNNGVQAGNGKVKEISFEHKNRIKKPMHGEHHQIVRNLRDQNLKTVGHKIHPSVNEKQAIKVTPIVGPGEQKTAENPHPTVRSTSETFSTEYDISVFKKMMTDSYHAYPTWPNRIIFF